MSEDPLVKTALTVAQLSQIHDKTQLDEHVYLTRLVDDRDLRGRACLGFHVADFNAPAAKIAWFATVDGIQHRRRSRIAMLLSTVITLVLVLLGILMAVRDPYAQVPKASGMVPINRNIKDEEPPVPPPVERRPAVKKGKR